jgi:hypothetical protein
MEDPRRMTPEERDQAHALLVRTISDPDWQPPARPWKVIAVTAVCLRQLGDCPLCASRVYTRQGHGKGGHPDAIAGLVLLGELERQQDRRRELPRPTGRELEPW